MFQFCPFCENMLYIKLQDSSLTFYCKNCGHIEEPKKENDNKKNATSILISEKKYNESAIDYNIVLSKEIKHDKTIPRVNNVKCPNKSCTKKNNENDEVMYILYDNDNMKYIYTCIYCDFSWKNSI